MLCLLLMAGLTPIAAAQNFLAVDKLSGDYYSIDCRSGNYTLIGGPNFQLYLWSGLAQNSQGEIYSAGFHLQQPSFFEIYRVAPSTGQLTLATTVHLAGVNAISFGSGDILYAAVDMNYPGSPGDFQLFSVDLSTGLANQIGPMGLEMVATMAFNGLEMFSWDAIDGLSVIDLNTGQATDVKPGFLGNNDLSTSICFSDTDVLYTLDYAFWLTEPTTGVSSFVDISYPGILGGVEYIPGPSQVLALWQTEQVGNVTDLKIRGATPGGQVAILAADDSLGSFLIPPRFQCAGTLIDMNSATTRLVTTATANAQGEINLGPFVLPMRARGHLRLQAIDLQTCITSNRIETVF